MASILHSLRFKFTLGLALFLSGVLVTVMFLLEQDIRASLVRENIDKGVGIARAIALNAEDPLLTGDDIALVSSVKNALRAPGIRYATIVDRSGQVRAANEVHLVGQRYAPPANARIIEENNDYRVTRYSTAKDTILDLEVPIEALAGERLPLGSIHLGLSEELVTRSIAAMRRMLQVLSLVVLILGGIAAYAVSALAVRPVHALVAGVKAVGAGDLNQHIPLVRKDELGVLTDAFNSMTASLREKEFIKNTFERYVSKDLADQILTRKDELRLGGEERPVTVLFCDLRGFTSLAEALTPPQVVEFLNLYFTELVRIIERHDGMVDKFIGDAVMALFGAPVPVAGAAGKAVQCAREIEEAVAAMNQRLQGEGRPPIAVRIGINSGPVIVGNIGASSRMEYTAIGDNVNLASRLETLNKLYGTTILLSESTRRELDKNIVTRELDAVQVLGKKQAVVVHDLAARDAAFNGAFAAALALYRQGDFGTAAQRFGTLAQDYDDAAAKALAERCTAYATTPPLDWHGIYQADSK